MNTDVKISSTPFCDNITARVIGVREFVQRLQVDSVMGEYLSQHLQFFDVDQYEAWQHEMQALTQAQKWVEAYQADHQNVRKALQQLPLMEKPLRRLTAKETLSDADLFECKRFMYFGIKILNNAATLLEQWNTPTNWSQNMAEWMQTIHPEAQPSSRFHLSDQHHPLLAHTRKEGRRLKKQLREANTPHADIPLDAAQISAITAQLHAVEDELHRLEETVRESLSAFLRPHTPTLHKMRDMLAHLDLRLAKVRLREDIDGCWASWEKDMTLNLHHGCEPRVTRRLAATNQTIQAVDFSTTKAPTVITGPNMGGKSVLLKLVGICQWAAQHAMPIPAHECQFSPVRTMVYVGSEAGDTDGLADEGLSSFGREIQRLVKAWDTSPGNQLWLLDEIGRGTHPEEGAQIAHDIVEKLHARHDRVIIASHFPLVAQIPNANCWRIKGLTTGDDELENLLTSHRGDHPLEELLNRIMDHRPIPTDTANIPRDARAIARALGLPLDPG